MDVAALKRELNQDEDRRDSAYQDSEGFWTIGVGHLIDARVGGRLPDEIIDALLDYDVKAVTADLDRALPWWRSLSDNRQLVLANMAFNLGIGRLLTFKKALAAMQRGDFDTAAAEMLDSKWAGQVGDRATRLADAMRAG